jgi:hypothetical protein
MAARKIPMMMPTVTAARFRGGRGTAASSGDAAGFSSMEASSLRRCVFALISLSGIHS